MSNTRHIGRARPPVSFAKVIRRIHPPIAFAIRIRQSYPPPQFIVGVSRHDAVLRGTRQPTCGESTTLPRRAPPARAGRPDACRHRNRGGAAQRCRVDYGYAVKYAPLPHFSAPPAARLTDKAAP